jgi:hypothetical protein
LPRRDGELGHFEVELVVFPLVTISRIYTGDVSFSIVFYRPMHIRPTFMIRRPTVRLVGWLVIELWLVGCQLVKHKVVIVAVVYLRQKNPTGYQHCRKNVIRIVQNYKQYVNGI